MNFKHRFLRGFRKIKRTGKRIKWILLNKPKCKRFLALTYPVYIEKYAREDGSTCEFLWVANLKTHQFGFYGWSIEKGIKHFGKEAIQRVRKRTQDIKENT